MISIIVPVYNVEKYVARCINSILNQAYQEYEVLLIDDGSTDSSGKICDAFIEKDSRIRVFHKPNGGAASARNYGLDRIRGEFFSFVDADDYLGPHYLSILRDLIEGEHADYSVIRAEPSFSEGLAVHDSKDNRVSLHREEGFKEVVWGRFFGVSPWGKLFRTASFRGLRFPTGMLYEDLYTIPYAIETGSLGVYSSSVQYYYFQRSGSLVHSLSIQAIEVWLTGMEKLYSFTEENYPFFIDYVICRYLVHCFPNVIDNLLKEKEYSCRIRAFQQRHIKWWKKAWTNPHMSLGQKTRAIVCLLSPFLYKVFYYGYQMWIKRAKDY